MASRASAAIRQALIATAVGLGLVAQQLVVQPRYGSEGWALYAVAVALLMWLAPVAAAAIAPETVSGTAGGWRWHSLWGAATLGAVALTTRLATTNDLPLLVLGLWIAGFVLGAAALRGWTVSAAARAPIPWTRAEVGALLAIILFAALARVAWIGSLPPYFFGDEPRVGNFLLRVYRQRIPNLFTMGWNTWPVIGMSLQGIFAPWLGMSTVTLRLSSAMVGTLAVGTTYLLARELSGRRLACLAALLLAMGRTAIDFSRLGVCHAQVMLYATFAFFWWWRAVNTGKAASYWWAGVGLGLCLFTYNAGQLVPVLWLGWVVLCALVAPRTARTHWRGVLLTLAGFVATTFAWAFFVTDHFHFGVNWGQWTVMARSRQILSEVRDTWAASGPTPALAILRRQVVMTWLGFTVLPAGAYGTGYRGGGVLDYVSGPLFVLGLGLTLRRARSRAGFLAYWWLVTAVVGSVLTHDPPAVVRMVGILPALALLAAGPLDTLLQVDAASEGRRIVGGVLVTGLLLGAGWDTWRTYFVDFARMPIDDTSELARQVQRMPADRAVLLLGAEHFLHFTFDPNCEIFPFEFPGRRLADVPDPDQFLPLHQRIDGPLMLVLGPTQSTLVDLVRRLYPETRVTDVFYGTERLLFRLAEIAERDVARRRGLTVSILDGGGGVLAERVADPFETLPLPADAAQMRWRGGIFWPTDQPATLRIEAALPLRLRLADTVADQEIAAGTTRLSLTLPLGWHPIVLEEAAGGWSRPTLAFEMGSTSRTLNGWDLRPEGEYEGLLATYERDGQVLARLIEPQLNSFAVEEFYSGTAHRTVVRMPFAASWRGALRVVSAGDYEFEATATGPFSVVLDGDALLEANDVTPDKPRTVHGSRVLSPGLHPLTAHWESRQMGYITRRQFQVLWTPPGGERSLIPPDNFVPATWAQTALTRHAAER